MEITFKYTKINGELCVSANGSKFTIPAWEVDKSCQKLKIAILDEKEHTHTVDEHVWDDWLRRYY
jgi:hypothetical protein